VKVCVRCSVSLALDQFWFDKKLGRRVGTCQPCRNELARIRYATREEVRQKAAENVERWRKDNLDHYKDTQASYKRRADVKERAREVAKQPENREKSKLKQRKHIKNPKNVATKKASRERAFEENPEHFRALARKQSKKKRARIAGFEIVEDVRYEDVYERDGDRCYLCESRVAHLNIDHIIPLAKGGHHATYNMAVSCAPCNLSKRDKLPENLLPLQRGRIYAKLWRLAKTEEELNAISEKEQNKETHKF